MAFLNDNHPLKKEVMLFIGGIREYKRLAAEDPTQGNNRESAGIPDSSPKLPLNNQQSMTDGKEEETNGNNAGNTETSGKQAGNRALDFASICQNSSIEDRLKMLSDHIDELSKDPTNHGRTCSPTLAFKKIPGRYDFVQDLFAAKLKEGKLAKKGNKYIINHTGTAA